MYQKTVIVGNLGSDSSLKFSEKGEPVTTLNVAVSTRKDDTGEWFTVEAHTPYMARKAADRECAKRGWDVMRVRSERV